MPNYLTKKLGEICDFQNGLWTAKKKPSKVARVLRNTNFRNGGHFDFSDVADIEVEEKQLASRLLQLSDLLLERSGGGPTQPVGRVMYFDDNGEFSFSNFTTRMRVKNPRKVDSLYLWRYLNYLYDSGITEKLQKQTTGIRNLIFSDYKQIEIPLPPVGEQKRIVARIEKAFAKIDEVTRLRAESETLAAELLPSALHEIFSSSASKGWEEKTLGELCRIQAGGTPSKSVSTYWDGGDIPWLRSEACRDTIVDHAEKFITRAGMNHSSARFFKSRTTLIALVGATIGRTGFLTFESSTNQNVAGLYPNNERQLLPEFLFVVARGLYPHFLTLGAGKFKMANLTFVKNLRIPLPPIAEQKAIVKKLDALAEKFRLLHNLQSSQSADFSALKQSILHQAFSA